VDHLLDFARFQNPDRRPGEFRAGRACSLTMPIRITVPNPDGSCPPPPLPMVNLRSKPDENLTC